MITTQSTSVSTLSATYNSGITPSITKLISYTHTWKKFKKWYDDKFFPLNENRFLSSSFMNQQGYLISFLKKSGVNASVYWEVESNMWVACVNSKEVDYRSTYDIALLSAINIGFHTAEKQ